MKVKVFRYDQDCDKQPRYETYNIEPTPGMRVLDVLHYIHDNIDATLSYRWMCRAGQCGSCSVRVNNKACLACSEPVGEDADEILIEPLLYFPVVKDLVVDLDSGYKSLCSCEPGLQRDSSEEVSLDRESTAKLKPFRECIECWCCVSTCPVVNQISEEYYGPLSMRKLCELDLDIRDIGDRVTTAIDAGLYNCTTCRNCWAVCPQNIEIPEKAIEQLRARAMEEGQGPLKGHAPLARSIDNYKNPWFMPRSRRSKWAKGLSIPKKAPMMFYAGCSPSLLFGDRVPKNIIGVLRKLGIEAGYLGKDEMCCASPLIKIGDREHYLKQARENIEQMKRAGAKTIVTTCAGCHKSWAVDYREEFGDFGIEVKHITEVLWELYMEGRFTFRDLEKYHVRVSYHDPCHLGRGSGVYEAPRNLIHEIPGLELIEGDRIRENSHCCGSGGGVKTAKPDLALKVGSERVGMFDALDVEYVITCCPWCEQHLDDSIAFAHSPLGQTIDLIEIVAETIEVDGNE